jgi:hypothetical protein
MFRFSRIEGSEYVPHVHANVFAEESASGTPRLVAAPAGNHLSLLFALAGGLVEPFYALWVLRVTRGRAEPGRYQSPVLPLADLRAAFEPYRNFLTEDGRSQLWLHSPASAATLVWDQHDRLYLYGPLEFFRERLLAFGLHPGDVSIDFEHGHHYHEAFDDAEESMASLFEWNVTPLRPDD